MRRLLVILLILSVLPFTTVTRADDLAQLKAQALETYAEIVYASYEDSYQLAVALQAAIEAFTAAPSEELFQAARQAWLAAREPYGQTEAYRFYGGPIDGEDGPEGLINAWPLDEFYIDYVEGEPEAGIINATVDYPTLDIALLESLNEQGGEKNIATGYHAIEFLLWGQDFNTDGAGDRPYTDYLSNGSAPNPERRALYLRLCAELLVSHLAMLRQAWQPNRTNNYRAKFLAMPPDEALGMVLTGIGVLSASELAGERLYTPYDNQDQEDEHSCFSDNTHRDIYNNALGIQNVYLGTYVRPDGTVVRGTSLADVIAALDPTRDAAMRAALDATWEAVQAVPTPFDQAIINLESRPLVLALVDALQDQGDQIVEVARTLGLRINTDLPE